MDQILTIVVYISLLLHMIMVGVAAWRLWRGENVVDRLIGFELIATLTLAILVLTSLVAQRSIYIDVALGLAALGFVSTIALAKYTADEQMF
jgi:multicomponent Na+:H+ antiporter subunit F